MPAEIRKRSRFMCVELPIPAVVATSAPGFALAAATITAWPKLACSFSATMRAVVSEALPGVTPDTRRMVLLGKLCAAAVPETSMAAASKIQRSRFNVVMVSSPVRPSDPGQAQLPGKPVGRPASIAIGAVVGIVPAVLDDQQPYGACDAPPPPLGVRSRHQTVLAPGHDEDRAGDLRGSLLHRQRGGVLQRVGLAYAMAAHAERLAREHRQSAPDLLPFERPGERDAGFDAFFVRGRARRVLTAEAQAPHAPLPRVEIGAFLDPVAHRARAALVVAADRDLVLRLALPRPVDREDRDTSREKRLRVGVQLLLGGIHARRHDENGRSGGTLNRVPQDSVEGLALERYRDALAGRAHKRKRRLVTVERAQVRVAHLLLIVHENELREVVIHRRAHQVLARRQLEALFQRLAPERLVHLAAFAPRRAPILPALDPGGHFLEICEQHAVRDEARGPVRDRRRDARVAEFRF